MMEQEWQEPLLEKYLRMRTEGSHVVQGLIDHSREFRLSVLSTIGKDCRVLGWGVR